MDEQEEKRCKFAADILYKFVTSKEQRLKYGATARQDMQKALKDGKKVEGYRAEWILKAMDEVIKALVKSSEKFNNTYFHDMISVDDMKDVLTSAINKLNNLSKKKSE
jgi:hypothetical protein